MGHDNCLTPSREELYERLERTGQSLLEANRAAEGTLQKLFSVERSYRALERELCTFLWEVR